jgi:hypothetical protein
MTWFLTGTAVTLWLFRKAIGRRLAPYLPDQTRRHQVLTAIIAAFAIVAVVRLVARFVTG